MRGYTPQVGHRVRGTVEGVVTGIEYNGHVVLLDGVIFNDTDLNWERLPDPEPDWQPGDVVRDANGDVFKQLVDGRWAMIGSNSTVDDAFLDRPLTRLVPES